MLILFAIHSTFIRSHYVYILYVYQFLETLDSLCVCRRVTLGCPYIFIYISVTFITFSITTNEMDGYCIVLLTARRCNNHCVQAMCHSIVYRART